MPLELLSQAQGWLFAVLVAGLVALEWLSPLRRRPDQLYPRWLTNIGLYLASGYLMFLLLPAGLVSVALNQPARGLAATGLSPWITVPLTALIIDAWRYWLHRWYHEVPLLWRAHLVHHSDTRLDVTTTERHHPLEVVVSLAAILALVTLLGLPAEGIAVYYLVSLAVSLVSHANIDLPPAVDRVLRNVIVTPAVHAIHHSDRPTETDSNYGNVLTLWDRLFATYTPPGHGRDIQFGLEYFRQVSDERFGRTLLQPFVYKPQPGYRGRSAEQAAAVDITGLLAACAAGFVIVTLALWPIAAGMVAVWTEREPWQYAFLVLPVFVYLVGWEYRDELLHEPIAPGWAGLVLAIPACVVVLLAELLALNIGKQIGLVLFYQAVLLGTVGRRVYLRYLPLWALLFLMVPYEDVVMPTLRAATLWSVEAMSTVAKLPFTADGFLYEVGGNRYVMVPNCAGVNFFSLAIFLGYSFGLIAFRRLAPLFGFTLMCAAAAVLANFFRVNSIIAIDLWRGTHPALTDHNPYRWVAFALMLALIVVLVSRLRLNRPVAAVQAQGKHTQVMAAGWWAPAAIASLSALVAWGATNLNDTATRDFTAMPPFATSEQLGEFRLQSSTGPWRERAGSGTAYSSTPYAKGSDQLNVIVEMPLSPAVKLDPQRIEPDEDRAWRHRRHDVRQGCFGSECISYEHNVWKRADTGEICNVYASYAFDGTLTASKLAVRLHRGLNQLLGAPDQATIVAIVSEDPITDPAKVAQHLMQVTAGLKAPALVAARSAVSQTNAAITPGR